MDSVLKIILSDIKKKLIQNTNIVIAIDGRCASGKSTLAAVLQEVFECNVIPMDHFFLSVEQRTNERMNEPGGNIDYERFLEEVLLPLSQGERFTYKPYDCKKQEMAADIQVEPHPVSVIEGSYSCHPALVDYYDIKIFVTVDEAEQRQRLRKRNGDKDALRFISTWIPLEEHYFTAFNIKERCDYVLVMELRSCYSSDST